MKHLARLVIALAFLLILPGQAAAQSLGSPYTPIGLKVVDVALVRPGMVVVSFASTAFFLGTLPLTFPIGVSEESAYLFVMAPWRFTALRFPGAFESYVDGGTAFRAGAR
jgi:hypothetical protein